MGLERFLHPGGARDLTPPHVKTCPAGVGPTGHTDSTREMLASQGMRRAWWQGDSEQAGQVIKGWANLEGLPGGGGRLELV